MGLQVLATRGSWVGAHGTQHPSHRSAKKHGQSRCVHVLPACVSLSRSPAFGPVRLPINLFCASVIAQTGLCVHSSLSVVGVHFLSDEELSAWRQKDFRVAWWIAGNISWQGEASRNASGLDPHRNKTTKSNDDSFGRKGRKARGSGSAFFCLFIPTPPDIALFWTNIFSLLSPHPALRS